VIVPPAERDRPALLSKVSAGSGAHLANRRQRKVEGLLEHLDIE
jgi:hypothetical protein